MSEDKEPENTKAIPESSDDDSLERTGRYQITEYSSGPLPDPRILKMYDVVQPGLGERIVSMAENQSNHRMEMEKVVVQGDSTRANWGLFAALFFGLACLGCGTFLIQKGHDKAGAAIVGTPILGVISTFIYGTNSRREERVRKEKIRAGVLERGER